MEFYPEGAAPEPRAARLPAPGWLPDPGELRLERYWDGTRWTARTRDRATKVETPLVPVSAATAHSWTAERSRPPRRFSIGRVLGATVAIVVLAYVAFEYATGAGYLPAWTSPAAVAQPGPAPAVPGDAGQSTAPPAPPAPVAAHYPLYGSTELVTYLEAALMAQVEEIDVSAWVEDGDTDALTDAIFEAVAQNPYVFAREWGIRIAGAVAALEPAYTYDDAEAERRRSATRQAAADALVASGAQDASGDAQRVTLIHDWIVENATYDHGVFEAIEAGERSPRVDQSQEAYGILVMGTAVCNGYAMAFTTMAEQVGLDTVIVTGTDSRGETGADHAWNKVRVDGQWLLVDATWDDPVGAPEGSPAIHEYLLVVDDDPVLDTRTADDAWIVDQHLGDFDS